MKVKEYINSNNEVNLFMIFVDERLENEIVDSYYTIHFHEFNRPEIEDREIDYTEWGEIPIRDDSDLVINIPTIFVWLK